MKNIRINAVETKKDDPLLVKIKVPNFIRLFAFKRILCEHMSDIGIDTRLSREDYIKDLVAGVFKNDEKSLFQAYTMLTRLTNDGINHYMSWWYHEIYESNIVEIVFNKIILDKFEYEYGKVTYFTPLTNDNDDDDENGNDNDINDNDSSIVIDYQCLVFNTKDIMCEYILQCLEYGENFDGDLFNCSLINTQWLFYVWNLKSLYFVNVERLIKETLNYNINDDNCVTRKWQRLTKVKSISTSSSCDFGKFDTKNNKDLDIEPLLILKNKFLKLRNVETINYYFNHQNNWDSQIRLKVVQIMIESFTSLNRCQVIGKSTIDDINDLFKCIGGNHQPVLMVINMELNINAGNNEKKNRFLSKFRNMCRLIFGLLENRRSVDIKLTLNDNIVGDDESIFGECNKIYLSQFDAQVLKNNCQAPICNVNVCQALVLAKTSFENVGDHDKKSTCQLCVTNVEILSKY